MELPRREREDVFLQDGTFGRMVAALRRHRGMSELRVGIVYAFDFRTRMLPYWYADTRMAPCAVRTLADVLHACGVGHIRVVLQQWTPNFRPSLAEIDGQPLDVLLVSAMQVHAEPSYALIRDAHRLDDNRPLILAGGPKAIYEPTDYFELGPTPGIGADCVVTGEAYVLLELLGAVCANRAKHDTMRTAFDRARNDGLLESIPGLVYLAPRKEGSEPLAINTGVQRLLRDLDEMPLPDAGYRLLEAPHRSARLRPQPLPASRVNRHSPIASVISTHGCKFNCPYCPIPAVNQRTWRHKSPARLAEEIRHLHESFGLRSFFSTDDNFFNHRDTVVDLMSELARARTGGASLGSRIRFFTEATQFDVYRNRDLLPLCRDGGMRAIWFGIEDITAELVNKGQSAGKTAELFDQMWELGIEPMAMMMHSDDQPLHGQPGDLSALLNQARYLFEVGAVSYQCTYLAPAVGTRDFEPTAKARMLYKKVNGRRVPDAFYDGNHVVASRHPRPWRQQLNVLRGYAAFYNPINTLRCLMRPRRTGLVGRRLMFQMLGQIGLLMTVPRLLAWSRRLKRGPIETWDGLQPPRIPMIDAVSGQAMNWAIENILPQVRRSPRHQEPASASDQRGSEVTLPILQPA